MAVPGRKLSVRRIIAVVDPSLSMRLKSSGVSAFDAGLSFVGKYAEREGIKDHPSFTWKRDGKNYSKRIRCEFEDKTEKLEPDYSRGSLEATCGKQIIY
jgi:hypothetical protein